MGCDGGTIPRRDELIKTKKKPEAKDKNSDRLYRWRHCAVSQTRLRTPIVSCELGRLYNKDEVITRLLDRSTDSIPHIKTLKDVKELRLTSNPGFKLAPANRGDQLITDQTAEYICPITAMEMNGKSRFVVIWSCGCVLSTLAMKEIKSTTCHKCNEEFSKDDVIPLNPTEEELPSIEASMVARREIVKAAKRMKKEAKRGLEDPSTSSEGSKKKIVKVHGVKSSKSSLLVNGMVSTVLQDSEFKKIRSASYSVASDPKASEVYKSLFDTHKSAQKKSTAHWVTCNPQYF